MCDASDFTIRAILGRKKEDRLLVIYYASKLVNEAQINYATVEKELLAVIYSINKFLLYLVGSKVTVYIEHKAIHHFMANKDAKLR